MAVYKNILRFSVVKLSVFLAALLFLVQLNMQAQDVTYSQFLNNPVYYNPAYTGLSLGMRARLSHRNQWSGLQNNFNNYAFSFDVAEPRIPGAGGLAIMVQSDLNGMGNIRTNSATFATSSRIMLARNMVTHLGLSVAYAQRMIDWNSFIFSDQLHPQYGVVRDTDFIAPEFDQISYPDFGFGLLLQYQESSRYFNFVVGTLSASLQHAFRPNISFTGNSFRMPYKMVVMGDVLLDNETGTYRSRVYNDFLFKLNPGFLFERQGDMTNLVVGSNAYKNHIYAGVWLRSQNLNYAKVNDLIFVLGLHLPVSNGSRFKFMYSYDHVISEVRRTIGATHEISLLFELDGFNIFGGTNMTERKRLGRGEIHLGYPSNPNF